MSAFSIHAAGQEDGAAPCVVTEHAIFSFNAIAARVDSAIAWLSAQGVQPTQAGPVAFRAEQNLNSLCLLLALFELAVPAMPLHPRWTETERRSLLNEGHGTALEAREVTLPVDDFAPREAPLPVRPTREIANPLLAIIHTSGSSGRPRAALLRHEAFTAAVQASALNLPWCRHDRWLLSLPLAHVGGLAILLRCLAARKPVVLQDVNPTGFNSTKLVELITSCQVSLLSLVPTQLQRLLAEVAACPAPLRAILLGGAAAEPELLRRARSQGWPLLATYGATETCSQIATQALGEQDNFSVGRALPGTELCIREGKICVRSATLFSGYYPNDPAPIDAQGWWTSGDYGALNEDGTLRVLGRADDVIVRGGENVFPLEVESALLSHGAVDAACVFGVSDPEFGQQVAVLLVCKSAELPSNLAPHLAQRLARFKRPQLWKRVPHIPLLPNGKPDRRGVAAAYPKARLDPFPD